MIPQRGMTFSTTWKTRRSGALAGRLLEKALQGGLNVCDPVAADE